MMIPKNNVDNLRILDIKCQSRFTVKYHNVNSLYTRYNATILSELLFASWLNVINANELKTFSENHIHRIQSKSRSLLQSS